MKLQKFTRITSYNVCYTKLLRLDADGVGLEMDLVPIQVVAISDPPFDRHFIFTGGLAGDLECLVGHQQIVFAPDPLGIEGDAHHQKEWDQELSVFVHLSTQSR